MPGGGPGRGLRFLLARGRRLCSRWEATQCSRSRQVFAEPAIGCQVEGQDEEQLRFLLAHDRDPFSRWEAGQRLLRMLLTALYSTAADESKVRMLRTGG